MTPLAPAAAGLLLASAALLLAPLGLPLLLASPELLLASVGLLLPSGLDAAELVVAASVVATDAEPPLSSSPPPHAAANRLKAAIADTVAKRMELVRIRVSSVI